MADFTYAALHIYSATDNSFFATDAEPGIATDGEGDITFEIGDSGDYDLLDPTNGDAPITVRGDYIGFLDFAGASLPVGFVPFSALPGPPSLLQSAFPDGAYIVIDPRDPATVTVPDTLDLLALDSGDFTVCFLPGTAIATPFGSTAVEALAIGDPILTADGRTTFVRWVGRQTVSTRLGTADRNRPVRISAGALGEGLPLRDLCVTADHALLIDGLLIHAAALVNGETITREPLSRFGGSFTVYHVETDAHEVILAEGMPAETFVDYVGRDAFDNPADHVAAAPLREMALPRITHARALPPGLRARLGIDRVA